MGPIHPRYPLLNNFAQAFLADPRLSVLGEPTAQVMREWIEGVHTSFATEDIDILQFEQTFPLWDELKLVLQVEVSFDKFNGAGEGNDISVMVVARDLPEFWHGRQVFVVHNTMTALTTVEDIYLDILTKAGRTAGFFLGCTP